MSNNKHWKKEENVTPISDDADLENTVNQSLGTTKLEVVFTEEEVQALLKVNEQNTVNAVLDVLKKDKYNMLDTITKAEAEKVTNWLEKELVKKGLL